MPALTLNNRPLRVLHVIDSLGLGGAQTVLVNLIGHGDRERFEYRVAALHGPGPFEDRLSAIGVPVNYLGHGRTDPLIPARLIRLVRHWQPDIVHAHLVISCFLSEKTRRWFPRQTRLVGHVHSMYRPAGRKDAYQNALEPLIYRRADIVLTCSPATLESIAEARPRHTRVPLAVAANGLQDALARGGNLQARERIRNEFDTAVDTPVFVSAGRLVELKNLTHALDILDWLGKEVPDFEYWIAGEGPMLGKLRERTGRGTLAGRVRFLGFRTDVPNLMSAADFFLLPSRHEGISMALLEAMGHSLIPVVTPYRGHDDVVLNGENGIVVPFEDSHAGAERLARVVLNQAKREDMAREALRTVQKRFTASRAARRIESIYERLIAHKPRWK